MDQQLAQQVKDVLSKLTGEIGLVYDQADHPQQGDLVQFLKDISDQSERINIQASNHHQNAPSFQIFRADKPTGIRFTGIPTGHEFTSLILAILNADGKGKFVDEGLQTLIKKIKGPVVVKTYISLTCENCPDVVQTLNQMALIHDDFKHEMIDGAFVQEEIKRLAIQGVPSVMAGNTLISSGRVTLADLLTRLTQHFGQDDAQKNPTALETADVVVVGGGPAGVSAAIYTARKGLKTVVIADKIGGQLNETKGIENFISVPYTEGVKLSQNLKEHLLDNHIRIYENRRVETVVTEPTKTVTLNTGETLSAKAIVIATGAKWRRLGIPGEAEYIGRGVAFCPHCDGPFYKGKRCSVIGGGNSGIEAAIDLAGIVKEVTVIEFSPTLKADDVLVKKAKTMPNITIITNAKTTDIQGDGQKVIGLHYEDRETGQAHHLPIDGIFVQIGLVPNSQCVKDSVACTPYGEIITDEKGRTSLPGIYAAGDVTTVPFKQIVIALGEGAKAGLGVFEEFIK